MLGSTWEIVREDAWIHVGDCTKEDVVVVTTEEEGDVVAEEEDPATTTTESPITTTVVTYADTTTDVPIAATIPATTTAAPAAPEEAEAEATTAPSHPHPPPCPRDYDLNPGPDHAPYTAGEEVTVDSYIFECNVEEGYERYCNIAVWDDIYLDEDPDALRMWTHAWVEVGPCAPTQMELMEEEVMEEEHPAT